MKSVHWFEFYTNLHLKLNRHSTVTYTVYLYRRLDLDDLTKNEKRKRKKKAKIYGPWEARTLDLSVAIGLMIQTY